MSTKYLVPPHKMGNDEGTGVQGCAPLAESKILAALGCGVFSYVYICTFHQTFIERSHMVTQGYIRFNCPALHLFLCVRSTPVDKIFRAVHEVMSG